MRCLDGWCVGSGKFVLGLRVLGFKVQGLAILRIRV